MRRYLVSVLIGSGAGFRPPLSILTSVRPASRAGRRFSNRIHYFSLR